MLLNTYRNLYDDMAIVGQHKNTTENVPKSSSPAHGTMTNTSLCAAESTLSIKTVYAQLSVGVQNHL